MTQFSITILANVISDDDQAGVPDKTRYTFDLYSDLEVTRKFIIDIPLTDDGSTDVWVLHSTVQVGDTPEDGFATFSPAKVAHKTFTSPIAQTGSKYRFRSECDTCTSVLALHETIEEARENAQKHAAANLGIS